jgi:hypothetical protein
MLFRSLFKKNKKGCVQPGVPIINACIGAGVQIGTVPFTNIPITV